MGICSGVPPSVAMPLKMYFCAYIELLNSYIYAVWHIILIITKLKYNKHNLLLLFILTVKLILIIVDNFVVIELTFYFLTSLNFHKIKALA